MPSRPMRFALIVGTLLAAPSAFAGTKLLRFPDVCGDKVVFTYAGDLWLTSTQGGTATRLTAGPGLEQSARFSPDCSRIAFTGEYGGDDQVYVIDATGGEPKQLTFYPAMGPMPQRWGFDNQVYGWTPDGKSILFRGWRDSISISNPHLYTVSVEGGLPDTLPMPTAGVGRYSPDGKQIVYSPKYRDFRTWNRYVGGWAQDLYIYDFAAKSAKNITNDPNTDRDPVWIGNGIYFVADRGEHLNLYRYDTASGETKQLTDYKDADARWASGDSKSQIAFEVDGVLHVYDTTKNEDRALDITVPSDLVRTRAEEKSVKDRIEDFALSANGKRVLFTAREKCSRRRSRTASRSISRTHRAYTSAKRSGRPTESASRMCRIRAARKRSGCAMPTATTRVSSRTRRSAGSMRRAGRRMACASRSSTARAAFASSRRPAALRP